MQYDRRLDLAALTQKHSVLLLGPRRTGKSWLMRHTLTPDRTWDLLRSDTFAELAARPALIRERLQPSDRLVVIDEIQKLPQLLDEIHLLIETTPVHFVLSGSSARKLRRAHTTLMAGRARTRHLHPLTSAELPDFDLHRALHTGLLPPVWTADDPWEELEGYVGEYLEQEVRSEALVRRIDGFSRFLRTAAIANAELLNFESIAGDAQVPARTVREHYTVLTDTLLGRMVEPWQLGRKAISHAKFYFFDTGVVHRLLGVRHLPDDGELIGKAFETWVAHELAARIDYDRLGLPLRFWRTRLGAEVDFVVGDHLAIEVKASRHVSDRDLRGLKALAAEVPLRHQVVVCREAEPRRVGDVSILPWRQFLQAWWGGALDVAAPALHQTAT